MKRIFSLFHKEIAGVHQAAFLIGAFTLLSQLLALVRDRMLAHYFGAGQMLDVYYTAFRIPDLIYASIASLVSISVLIPFLSSIIEQKKEESKKFINSVFTVFLGAMVIVSVTAWFLMPYIIHTFFSNLGDEDVISQIINLSRLLLLQPICLGISNMLGVITQIGKRFFTYASSSILYNLSILFGLVFLYPYFGMNGVIYGVIGGGVAHFLIQVPYVRRTGLLPRITTAIDFQSIKEIIKISIPRTIALSGNMIELIIITSFASWIAIGSVSVLNLALNLQSAPFAIVGVSYALAAFPTLSACFAKGERGAFMNHIITAARHVIFWSIPISALFIVLRAQIVRTVLGSGAFNWDNTRLTAACLALFVISLVAQGLELLFIRAYYAAGKTMKPLMVNILSSCATIGLPFVLLTVFNSSELFKNFMEALFKVEGIPGSAVLMLPLGYSLGTLLNALVFWILFEYDFGNMLKYTSTQEGGHIDRHAFTEKILPTFSMSIQAAVCGGFVAYLGLNLFSRVFDLTTLVGIFAQGFFSGLLGVAGAVLVLVLLGNSEIIEIYDTFKQKIWKKNKIIVSEPDRIEN